MKAKQLFPNDAQPDAINIERFYAASIILQKRALAYACMLMQMEVVWTRAIGTAATDGRYVYISPDFFLSLENDEQRAFLLAHEIAHVVLRHVTRGLFYRDRGFHTMRDGQPVPWIDRYWNVAADKVINADLIAMGLQRLPQGLYDKAVGRNDLVDEVYIKEVQNRVPEEEEEGSPGRSNDPFDDVPDNPAPGSADDDDADDDDESAESESGSSSADDDDADDADDGAGGSDNEPNDADHGGFDEHLIPEYEGDEEEQDQAAEADDMEVNEKIKEAAEEAKRQGRPGTESGVFGRALADQRTKESHIDWRVVLAEYVTRVCNSGQSDWSRVNRRRFAVTGVLTPSHKGILTRMVTVVDRSGSALHCLPIFMTEFGRILDTLTPTYGAAILWTDTQVLQVDEVYTSDELSALSAPRGGGTELWPALDRIDEEGWDDAEVLILLTDGEMFESDVQRFADRGALMVLDQEPWSGYREMYARCGIQYVVCSDAGYAA